MQGALPFAVLGHSNRIISPEPCAPCGGALRQPKDELLTSGQPIGRNRANPVCWGYFRLARLNEAARRRMLRVTQSDGMYALEAKAAILRRARRLLPALAAILIPASVLSKKSAMLSRSAFELISR